MAPQNKPSFIIGGFVLVLLGAATGIVMLITAYEPLNKFLGLFAGVAVAGAGWLLMRKGAGGAREALLWVLSKIAP